MLKTVLIDKTKSTMVNWEVNILKCSECEGDISIPKDAIVGEIVTCPDCGVSFELHKVDKGFELKPAQVEGEDWGE